MSGTDAGRSLADVLAAGRMPLGEAIGMLDELSELVGEGHRSGRVHGALDPRLVRLEGGGRVRVDASLPEGVAADLSYRSPQELTGKQADPRSDVFALGVIGYRAVTGVDPFGAAAPLDASGEAAVAARIAAIEAGPIDPRSTLPKLSERVARTLVVALARNLTERFADALTMRAALRGDSQVALDSPTLKWAVPEGIPEGDTGAADEFAASE